MIEIPIKPEWGLPAFRRAVTLGQLKNSITKGEGNMAGMLGEIVVANHINGLISDTYDYDIISPKGYKIDVKTKQCTSKPLPHYECSIAAYNTTQECNYYVFVRILNSLKIAWICGYIEKNEYFSLAKLYKKGYIDESNGMTFSADAYNLPISQLKQF